MSLLPSSPVDWNPLYQGPLRVKRLDFEWDVRQVKKESKSSFASLLDIPIRSITARPSLDHDLAPTLESEITLNIKPTPVTFLFNSKCATGDLTEVKITPSAGLQPSAPETDPPVGIEWPAGGNSLRINCSGRDFFGFLALVPAFGAISDSNLQALLSIEAYYRLGSHVDGGGVVKSISVTLGDPVTLS